MSAPPLPESLTGVGVTAIGVAMIRAKETARPDHLYQDPYAQAFVTAAQQEFQQSSADAASLWSTIEGLVEVFYQGRTVGVRMGDDSLREAAAAGRRQIVMLGAGLDTHAFRLDLPSSLHLFEIDVPELFAFKERVLRQVRAIPTCRRSIVPTDLRQDWSTPLLQAGFQPDIATHWIDAGVLAYLLREQAWQVADTITDLSAPNSLFGFGYIPLDAMARRIQPVPGAERVMPGMTTQAAEHERGLGPDAPQRLERTGWQTEFRELAPIAAAYGRPLPDSSGGGSITAIRQQGSN
jgi:methyltransferase (TIGR00027 family)